MGAETIQDFILRAINLRESLLTVNLDFRLDKNLLRNTLLEIFKFEGMVDFMVKGIPMCFTPDFFYHLDNEPSPKKVKSMECFSCAMNYFCKGFLPEMEGFVNKAEDKPKEIVIEVTDRCNLKCPVCFNRREYPLFFRNSRPQPTTEEIKKIISGIKTMDVNQVRFSGGEPMVREDLIPLARFAKGLGLSVWLNTNATLASRGNISKGLFENVLVSINGFDEASERQATGGSFSTKIDGIKALRKVHTLRGGVVLTEVNIRNIERFYKLAEELCLDSMEFYRPIGRAQVGLEPAIDAIHALNRKYWKGYRIANAIPFCFYKPEILHRIALGGLVDDGACRMVVDTKGDIKPSYYSKPIGNLRQMTLLKAWNSLGLLRRLDGIQKQCTECIYVHTCRGGSRAAGHKDPLMKRPIIAKGSTHC